MAAGKELDGPPPEFESAVRQLRAAPLRPEIRCEEMPAPQRIAPYSAAMTGDIVVAGDEIGTGRIVMLHDPSGNDAWHGTFRLVTFARADVDPEMLRDPVIAEVGWTWLTEALEANEASLIAPSGSVTTVASEGFGGLADDGSSAQLEIRASWTPTSDIGDHVTAWGDLLCTVAGLPPLAPGVAMLSSRRVRRG
ncbi:DUF3000 domain-containing protein [Solicola gregarius]|uniref:DUF3000 domain-containing protein n=1 Tax=Solicola gregarius TaxID=2908642 RepID=A0AA46TGD5_9ACTN|nr:DUF3000 domain-containing protein [Solicola gregarius]UYM04765.1 DUF3000 domain-containing protein [Solicola gregarius]